MESTRELVERLERDKDEALLAHLSKLFIDDNLSPELTARVAFVLQTDPKLLLKAPKDIRIHLKDADTQVNGILFSITSREFRALATSTTDIHFPKMRKAVFDVIEYYFEHGTAEDLWRFDANTLLDVYTTAIEWDIEALREEAPRTLKRYITRYNYLEILKKAMENRWQEYYTEIIQAANTYDLGVIFHEMPVDFLKIEFLDYRESAMDLFEALKPRITHLGFFGNIMEDARFTKILQEMPNLLGFSLNETKMYSDRLQDISGTIEELDLAANPWIRSEHLKFFAERCPMIKHLNLKSLVNLDFRGFGVLKTLPLESLDVTKCFQIRDEDMILICQSAPDLLKLNLEGCELLTDRSLETIAKYLWRLEELNLSRLSISDSGLIDLCHRLKHLTQLNLERCASLSEKGVMEAVEGAVALKKVCVAHTQASKEMIQKVHPGLRVC